MSERLRRPSLRSFRELQASVPSRPVRAIKPAQRLHCQRATKAFSSLPVGSSPLRPLFSRPPEQGEGVVPYDVGRDGEGERREEGGGGERRRRQEGGGGGRREEGGAGLLQEDRRRGRQALRHHQGLLQATPGDLRRHALGLHQEQGPPRQGVRRREDKLGVRRQEEGRARGEGRCDPGRGGGGEASSTGGRRVSVKRGGVLNVLVRP